MELWILNLFVSAGFVDNIENLSFEKPDWLWLAVIWPLFWLVASLFAKQVASKDDLGELQANQQLRVKHALIHRLQKVGGNEIKGGWSLRLTFFNLLRGLILVGLAVALATPVQKLPEPPKPEPKTVRDIVFVIESSASFLLPDYQIAGKQETRMNVVKQVLDDFIAKLDGNRFSVAIYADKAYTMLPLTYDQTVARLTLKRLKPYLAGRTDVAMGEALGLALKQTDTANVSASSGATEQGRKKVLVLISDGLSLPSRIELTEAVNYAQLLDVPIYTIGVGASSEAADQRLYSGLLYQPLESESLQAIAQQTGGKYYRVGSGQEISSVLEQINQAEGVPYIPPPAAPQKRQLYPIPLILTLIFLGIYWLLSLIWMGSKHEKLAGGAENA